MIEDIVDHKDYEYSISGVMQFLHNESMKNEMLRAQWNVDKAELQARIAFLQGERRGQENLMLDLMRRIKMLEFSLEMETEKMVHLVRDQLRAGESVGDEDADNGVLVENNGGQKEDVHNCTTPQYKLTDIKELLLESGYQDLMAEVRETRVKQLLGLDSVSTSADDSVDLAVGVIDPPPSIQTTFTNPSCTSSSNSATKEASIAKMHFDSLVLTNRTESHSFRDAGGSSNGGDDSPIYDTVDDSGSSISTTAATVCGNKSLMTNDPDTVLGELASLTIANEAEGVHGGGSEESKQARSSAAVTASSVVWSAKFTLRSHFDAVRCVGFHPGADESGAPLQLFSGSEDGCLKLWDLAAANNVRPGSSRKKASSAAIAELEPLHTFRGHVAPVLALTVASNDVLYSSDLDGAVKAWKIPYCKDLYDEYSHANLQSVTRQQAASVWSLAYQKSSSRLVTGASDGKVMVWRTDDSTSETPNTSCCLEQVHEWDLCPDRCISTVQLLEHRSHEIVLGTADGRICIVDLETGIVVRQFTYDPNDSGQSMGSHIHQLIEHPGRGLVISGHEDRHIRLFDLVSGQLVSSLAAHLGAVTGLALEHKSGSHHLLSASHDCSVRVWDLTSQACIQETTTHRKKFDEAIHAIIVHPSLPYFATAGADAVVKVFV